MKVALAHDWLIHMRGGEKVLSALAEIYPDAVIYTLFTDRRRLNPVLAKRQIRTTFLQHLPGIRYYYRWLLPVLPWITSTLRVEPDTELLISSSHCVIKGIRIPSGCRHMCYCHTPMRYLWGLEGIYFDRYGWLLRRFISFVLERLRKWDRAVNDSVDAFIANSRFVRERIRTFYGRDAEVVYPPLESRHFSVGEVRRDYYLVVSAFVPYKRVDLVIEAFNRSGKRLFVVGKGPLEGSLKKMRKSPEISFLGAVGDEELKRLYAEARALIFPTEEDFGIVPLEAQACGTSVIALGRGGALESVKTGLFFEHQTSEALCEAVERFETGQQPPPREIAAKVTSFDKEEFKRQIRKHSEKIMRKDTGHVPAASA